MSTLRLPRHTLFYQDHQPSSERAVLLLHGLGVTSDSWVLQIPELVKAGFRVIAPDTRGFGRSGYPGRSSIHSMVQDFMALLDALQIERAAVVGLSMGGTQALQFALDHPARLDRLVLANTFASLRPRSLKVWSYFVLRFGMVHLLGIEAQANYVARRIFPPPAHALIRQQMIEQVRQASPAGYRAAMRALGLFDVTARLGEIHAQTLVITGELDTTVPPDVQAILVQRIPGARQVVIPGVGHAASVENPEAFNRCLISFLSDRI
ncbi:MAG: alpha/beta hydrolase [Anaerolineales bacterium]|jgi:3-oxoadipate enol-lactonase|nr:alpha/beta hydrolase [Anaerolineales bacterium]